MSKPKVAGASDAEVIALLKRYQCPILLLSGELELVLGAQSCLDQGKPWLKLAVTKM